jgi:uncharacterized protein YjbI with pentapeptide repeats
MSEITLKKQLLEAYGNGQRYFEDIDLDLAEDLEDVVLSGAVFKLCSFNVGFLRADLSNCQFIDCNLKTADFRHANLTNASMIGCAVESTRFADATVTGFVFNRNSVYSQDASQVDFDTFHLFT